MLAVERAASGFTDPRSSTGAVVVSYAFGLLTAACLGYFLIGIPIQVSDSFGNMLQLRRDWSDLVVGQFYQRAFLRPFLWAELKLVFDAAQGNYFEWFRGVHVAQVFALVMLFLWFVKPRTWRDAAVVPLGLAALVGIHTFEGTVVEAFPVNTYLTILLCCLAAANLALMCNRWWVDVAAAALFVVSALTVESGLLVWVIFAGAGLVGARGVSRGGQVVLALLLAGYFVLRFSILDVGSPGLDERSSGFGLQVLDPPELINRFGAFPYGFYAYNVITSFVSVLFGEPRAGVFRFVQSLTIGDFRPLFVVNVVASSFGTILISAFLWRRRREWLAFRFDRDDAIVALFLMVLTSNAVISYPYTKDVIMSPAGVFFAAALFVAARRVLFEWIQLRGVATVVATAVFCAALGSSWAIRELGTYVNLRLTAFKVRNDWSYARRSFADEGTALEGEDERLFRYLFEDAVLKRGTPKRLLRLELPVIDLD